MTFKQYLGIKKSQNEKTRLLDTMIMLLLMLMACLPLQAQAAITNKGTTGQITIHYNKVSAADLLNELARQSGYNITFNSIQFEKEYVNNLHYKNQPFNNVVKDLEKKTKLVFMVSGNHVSAVVNPKKTIIKAVPPQQSGRIFGKIIDDRGETLVGANVKLEQTGKIVQSSVDGSFDLSGLKAGTYTIEVSYISFQTKRITDIVVKDGQPTKLDVVLAAAVNNLNQVVVTGYKKESIAGLYARQKNSASTTDGITAEQIARTPDNNVAQVLSRVSGLNVQEGKYVTVRGLSDRYNNVMLNGSQLPSTEPNKRNFAFDIIPSSMIDNVIVHKTASANLSGEFSGGIVEVDTRSIPTENFFRIKVGTGMNTKATGKDFYQPQRGKYDFLAFDDNRKFGKGFDGAEYDRLAFNNNNTPADDNRRNELLQKFPNRFKMYNYRGMPVQEYDISGGRVSNFKNGNRFGIIAGLTYRNQQTATDYLDQLEKNQYFKYEGTEYDFSTTWSAMLNTGYSFGKNKIGFKNIYSRKLAEQSYLFSGKDLYDGNFVDGVANTPLINSILQSRLEGEHKVGEKGPLLKWHGSLSRTEREEPDNKTHIGYSQDSIVYRYVWVADALQFSNNYSSTFTEDRYTWAAEADMPFELLGRKQLVKGGYQGSYRKADFSGQMYAIPGDYLLYDGLPYYDAFAPENFKVGGLSYAPYIGNPNAVGKSNGYNGFQRLNSGYLMFDGKLLKALRLVAGMRMEHNVTANRSAQIAYIGDAPVVKDSLVQIDKVDWLPSATLIYALTPKTNIRASYFGSVARPDLRELSTFTYYDAPRRTYITGSDLKPTQIDNADLRFEYYPAPDEIISVSGFYKKFKNPIELQLRSLTGQNEKTAQMFYQNLEEASNLGFEVNFRKSFGFINNGSGILNKLFLSGNFTWMHSKLKLAGEDFNWGQPDGTTLVIVADQNRPLWGQAPYLINGGLLYAGDKLGLNLSYTRVGERIIYGSQEARYNEWEKARDVLDAQISYRFLKSNKAEVKLNFSDLINQPVIRYFNGFTETVSEPDANGVKLKTTTVNKRTYNKDEDELRRSYNYGRNFSLSISYTF